MTRVLSPPHWVLSGVFVPVMLLLLAGCAPEEEALPSFHRWGRIELIFHGPAVRGLGDPNPFEIPFDVMFTGPDGSTALVPGFYDGDGQGGLDGNVWKVRFSADRNGAWSWHTQSTESSLDGLSGHIGIVDPPLEAPDFFRLGRLEYVGERYLKFREGGYWIKAGADEPENILGSAFGTEDWEAKKRQLDYLATTGVNSIYVMTHTLEGDSEDVWPWVGATQEEAKQNLDRYDVAKLERWRDFLEYAQQLGLVIHLVLEDDSAWTGYHYTRYYREIVARFGYLPALYFNFGEQYHMSHTLEEALDYMKLLATLDPYDHPRAIHNVNLPQEVYVRNPAVHLASIAAPPSKPETLNRLAGDWFQAPLALQQRPLVVSFDEAHPAGDRRSWWAVYLGGGVWESILPVEREYREHDREWRELGLVRQFLEPLPVERMFPANHLITEGKGFCLASPGEVYAVYLPEGGEAELELVEGNRYRVSWFNPRPNGGDPWERDGGVVDGGAFRFDAGSQEDWALKIERVEGQQMGPVTAISAQLISTGYEPVSVHMATLPAGPDPDAEYRIVSQPKSGTLSGEGSVRTYTPRPGFTGSDSFRWRFAGTGGESNIATVEILCNPTGENSRPRVYDQSVTAQGGEPLTVTLQYTDRDGPGLYAVRITAQPKHGTLAILDNEATYVPEPGYAGSDSFKWLVSDGAGESGEGVVRITVRRPAR